ncbi:phage holin [Domibacillus tundrae]|uniref:phage holin n=1 Tax=Domibacillus tundrae TaxID=1587527 RepID=UPI000617CA8A|nr:phage holin [Domibacillus tundrae]
MKNLDKGTIVRTVVLFVMWGNQFLVINGYSPLPLDSEMVEMGTTSFLTFCASLWAWWKNNNITRKARRNEELLKREGLK